jgi:hypothetical protein
MIFIIPLAIAGLALAYLGARIAWEERGRSKAFWLPLLIAGVALVVAAINLQLLRA